ncbi:alpha/beta fold hydrolase [Candidatus Neomarinimicrobiota bacterium]
MFIYLKHTSYSLLTALTLLILGCGSPQKDATGTISVNGIEVYYRAMGSGTPTFVLHGGPGDNLDMMLQLGALADQYKMIFYDQRAAGRSTGDADTASHTIEMFVEDLEQLRHKLGGGEKINIIGGSWGAMLAMQYAMKYSANINALVLMSTIGITAESGPIYQAKIASNRTTEDSLKLEQIFVTEEFAKRLPDTMVDFWRTYFRAYFYNPDLADNIKLWMRDTTYQQVPGRYAKLGKFLNSYDITDDLKNITCPTLILYGDYDATPIEWVTPIQEGIAGSQMKVIENAGHWLWVEAPDQVIPMIREYLAEH